MKALFKHISDTIEAAAPEVRWIDFDLGQLEQEHPPVSFPCALINFVDIPYENLGSGVISGEALVSVRVAFRVFERTHSKAAAQFRDVGLSHLDVVDKVFTAIEGTQSTDSGTISRNSFSTEPRADLRVYLLTFQTTIYVEPEDPFTPIDEVDDPDNPGTPVAVDLCIDHEME